MDIGSNLLNISAITVGVILVPLLWLFLFLFLWEDRAYAQSIGFERWTFWLLTAAVVLSVYAETTLFPFDGDYLAINIGGAVIPLVLSSVLFAYFAPPRSRSLPIFLSIFAAEAAAAFAVVVLVPTPAVQTLGVVAVAALATLGAVALPRSLGPTREVAALVGLSSGVLVLTFVVSSTVPGVGIEVEFPQYLVGPIAAGAVAAILGSYLYGSETGRAVPLAYAATTFGVIIGADLLRQPPLYASSLKGLYVIGGGNYSDLVYLSPLLALAVAYLFLRYMETTHVPATDGIPLDPTSPYGALAEAVRSSFSGTSEASLAISREASHAAADQARILLRAPPARADRPWQGLPVPGWVAADQANLDLVSQRGPFERVEAERGAQTARALVGLGRRLTMFRFATIPRRAAAYAPGLVRDPDPRTVGDRCAHRRRRTDLPLPPRGIVRVHCLCLPLLRAPVVDPRDVGREVDLRHRSARSRGSEARVPSLDGPGEPEAHRPERARHLAADRSRARPGRFDHRLRYPRFDYGSSPRARPRRDRGARARSERGRRRRRRLHIERAAADRRPLGRYLGSPALGRVGRAYVGPGFVSSAGGFGGTGGGGDVRVNGIVIDETFVSRPSRLVSRSVAISIAPTATSPGRRLGKRRSSWAARRCRRAGRLRASGRPGAGVLRASSRPAKRAG
ncbi:MAG: DUF1614 domain-containing protein [Thermoplasmatales archaeon]|nr:DUF1614 domain-containing protein [Thermoplasmatales archaeon]